MKRIGTTILFSLVFVFVATPLFAQTITSIRDINAIPQANVDQLNGGGENLDVNNVPTLIYNTLNGTEVTIQAVIMTDPRNSGLSNVTDGRVNRVHFFVRDVLADTEGPEGMGIQIVDGAYDTNNILSFGVGDVLEITGNVSPFGTAMQVSPTSVSLLGFYADLGYSDSILDPIVVSSSDINMAVGSDGGVQVNWSNLADLRNAFVRIEDATIVSRDLTDPDRPDFYMSSDGGTTVANFYDTGLQFRNDRSDYPDEFNNADDDFAPPPPGSVANVQGVLVFQGGADAQGRGTPADMLLSLAPFERRGCDGTEGFRCDLEVTQSPPILTDVQGVNFVPDGSADVEVSFVATADPTRSIVDNFCVFHTSEDATEMTVTASAGDMRYICTIPAQTDGVFTTWWAGATDNTGATTTTDPATFLTLADGINEVADVQITPDGGPGDGPFRGLTTTMAITATVRSSPATSGFLIVQDGDAPWSGVTVELTDEVAALDLQFGDVVSITEGTLAEIRGPDRFDRGGDVTGIANPTLSVVGEDGGLKSWLAVSTADLQDPDVAEAHESMMLIFTDVTITSLNADFFLPFETGEFAVSSDGTADNEVRVDDQSDALDPSLRQGLTWGQLEYVSGVWSHTFGNYKLMPEELADIGNVTNTSVDGELPGKFALDQNYPNPFNPTTTIQYEVAATGHVTLAVYDLLGRQVATLVDGAVTAGSYEVNFEASNLPSGLYLYRLQSGNVEITKKMMLLK